MIYNGLQVEVLNEIEGTDLVRIEIPHTDAWTERKIYIVNRDKLIDIQKIKRNNGKQTNKTR